MSRSPTTKAGRRQHRGVVSNELMTVVDWVRENCHPAFRDGIPAYQKSLAAALQRGDIKQIVFSPRIARGFSRAEALLAEYQAEHPGQMPPSLYEIFGEGQS